MADDSEEEFESAEEGGEGFESAEGSESSDSSGPPYDVAAAKIKFQALKTPETDDGVPFYPTDMTPEEIVDFYIEFEKNMLAVDDLSLEEGCLPGESVPSLLARFSNYGTKPMDKAIEKISNYLRWRRTAKVSEIWEQTPGELLGCDEEKALGVLGVSPLVASKDMPRDKCGRLCVMYQMDNYDLNKLYAETSVEQYIEWMIWRAEKMGELLSQERKEGRTTRFCYVIDYGQVWLMCLGTPKSFKFLRAVNNVLALNYPNLVDRILIINVPSIFNGVWKMASPLLNPITTRKMKFMGTDYLKEIGEYITEEALETLWATCRTPSMK